MKWWAAVVAIVVGFGGDAIAKGQRSSGGWFTTTSGFRLKIPKGWTATTNTNELSPGHRKGAVLKLRASKAFPINRAMTNALRKQLKTAYGQKFPGYRQRDVRQRKLGGAQAVHLRATFVAAGKRVHMSQIFIRPKGAKRLLIVTCIVRSSVFGRYMKPCERTFSTVMFGSTTANRCVKPTPAKRGDGVTTNAIIKYRLDLNGDGRKDLLLAYGDECGATDGCNFAIWLTTKTCPRKIGELSSHDAITFHGKKRYKRFRILHAPGDPDELHRFNGRKYVPWKWYKKNKWVRTKK